MFMARVRMDMVMAERVRVRGIMLMVMVLMTVVFVVRMDSIAFNETFAFGATSSTAHGGSPNNVKAVRLPGISSAVMG